MNPTRRPNLRDEMYRCATRKSPRNHYAGLCDEGFPTPVRRGRRGEPSPPVALLLFIFGPTTPPHVRQFRQQHILRLQAAMSQALNLHHGYFQPPPPPHPSPPPTPAPLRGDSPPGACLLSFKERLSPADSGLSDGGGGGQEKEEQGLHWPPHWDTEAREVGK